MIYRTYVQDKPFRAVQALRRDTHLLQIYFTACRTRLCKGHELGSDRIKRDAGEANDNVRENFH